MTAPVPPYTTTSAVAYMGSVPLKGGTDFSASTVPTKSAVEDIIDLISGHLDMMFQMAGYKIPFQIMSGESWPESQTTYLKMVTTLGSAAMALGHSQRPAPALAPGREGGTGNLLQDLYNAEVNRIFDLRFQKSFIRFRAQYWPGTPAEFAIGEYRGPTTDFMEGRFDPERYMTTREIADRMVAIQRSMRDLDVQWDYLYGLWDLNKGFGVSTYE